MKLNGISAVNFGNKSQNLKKVVKAVEGIEPDFSKSAYSVPTGLTKECMTATAHDYFPFSAPIFSTSTSKSASKAVESYEYLSESMIRDAKDVAGESIQSPKYIFDSTIVE